MENCLRQLRVEEQENWGGSSSRGAFAEILTASEEMIKPTVYGQAMIMIVYIPILSLSGVEGKMFHPMALTVIFALIAAFILSLTFVPAMIALCIKEGIEPRENTIVAYAKRCYAPLLEKSLAYPGRVAGFALGVVALSLFLFSQLGQEFVPRLDEKDIAMHAIRIPSTSLTQSTELQMQVEKAVLALPQVATVFSKTGTAEMASDPMPPNVSDTFIILKPRSEWPDPQLPKLRLIDQIQTAVNQVPGNTFEFTQPIEMRFNELISGVRSDLAVKVYGDDFKRMQKTADAIASRLRKIPGSADVKTAQTQGLPVLDIKMDRDAVSRLGINVSDGLKVLAVAAGGGKAGQIFEGDRRFDILVRLPEFQREDVAALARLPVPLPALEKGTHFPHVPLGEIATLEVAEGLNEVRRENGKRFVAVQANVRNRDLGSYVQEAKQRMDAEIKIPDGYWMEWGGQFENLMSARHRLFIVIPLCLSLLFLLLYTAFNSFLYALLVFTGIPLALTGGTLALWLRGMPFSISAAIGFIALSGIAVLNGLVLISCINSLRATTTSVETAVKEGALMRLRPVLITALVASLGFVPMALATGTGAEVQKPLATVVIGGLISSTLLTLVLLPALYLMTSRDKAFFDEYVFGLRHYGN